MTFKKCDSCSPYMQYTLQINRPRQLVISQLNEFCFYIYLGHENFWTCHELDNPTKSEEMYCTTKLCRRLYTSIDDTLLQN